MPACEINEDENNGGERRRMAVQEGKVPGKSFFKERRSCLAMCVVAPRVEGHSPAGGQRSRAFVCRGDVTGQAVDPWANWQEPGFLQSCTSPRWFYDVPEG